MCKAQTPLAFCGLKSAKQLALERPSVYEVANRGAPQIVNDKTIIPMTSRSVFWLNKLWHSLARATPRRVRFPARTISYVHWDVDFGYYYGHWTNVKDRYLGLKFKINGKFHYGWALAAAVSHSAQSIANPHFRLMLTPTRFRTSRRRKQLCCDSSHPDSDNPLAVSTLVLSCNREGQKSDNRAASPYPSRLHRPQ